jgi:hypothetical protein
MSGDKKRELVDFLVGHAFEPVMRATPDGRSDADKARLDHVREATRAEIERFRNYGSAEEVLVNFRRDLRSRPAKKVHAELRKLDLPTIEDIREEFEKKADELGVEQKS